MKKKKFFYWVGGDLEWTQCSLYTLVIICVNEAKCDPFVQQTAWNMCAHALKHAAASDSAGVVFWNDHLLAIFSVSTDATPKSNSCVFTWRIPRHCHACCWPSCEIRWKWSKWKNNARRKHYAPPLIFFFIGQFGHANWKRYLIGKSFQNADPGLVQWGKTTARNTKWTHLRKEHDVKENGGQQRTLKGEARWVILCNQGCTD